MVSDVKLCQNSWLLEILTKMVYNIDVRKKMPRGRPSSVCLTESRVQPLVWYERCRGRIGSCGTD